jgi:hypothetical protein
MCPRGGVDRFPRDRTRVQVSRSWVLPTPSPRRRGTGVQVYGLCPGRVATDMQVQVLPKVAPRTELPKGRCPAFQGLCAMNCRRTTHMVMSPVEFMQRLATLTHRPRLHLLRFHGGLAPNARLRPNIIPNVPVNANTPSADHGEVPLPAAPASKSWGGAAQTSVRDRHRAVSPVRWHFEDHRRHRAPPRPSTAPSSGQVDRFQLA